MQAVEALGGKYHWQCFCCTVCLLGWALLFFFCLAHSGYFHRAVRNHSKILHSSCGTIDLFVNGVTASFSRARYDHTLFQTFFFFSKPIILFHDLTTTTIAVLFMHIHPPHGEHIYFFPRLAISLATCKTRFHPTSWIIQRQTFLNQIFRLRLQDYH
jgi:hypothetical protein